MNIPEFLKEIELMDLGLSPKESNGLWNAFDNDVFPPGVKFSGITAFDIFYAGHRLLRVKNLGRVTYRNIFCKINEACIVKLRQQFPFQPLEDWSSPEPLAAFPEIPANRSAQVLA